MVPELLLGNVFLRAGIDPHDAHFVAQLFKRLGVVLTYTGIDNAARHQVNALDLFAFTECARQIDHVERLAAGIGIAAEFEICPRISP